MKNERDYSEDVIKGVKHEGQAVILELTGEVDLKSSADLKAKLKELYQDKPPVIIVDMTEVEFMDSSGLATLIGALKWCRVNNSELKLVGLIERVRSIFEICLLDSVFKIYNSRAEALSS